MNPTRRKSAGRFVVAFNWVTVVYCTTTLILGSCCATAGAQPQVLVETPFQQTSNGFYENFGVGWNYSNGNFSINVPNGVRPPFGMGDPNADARLSFNGTGSGGSRFGLNFTLGQGNTRTNSVTSPMIMLPNGGTGAIFDGSFRPFVTGFIPVVGDGGPFVPATAAPRWVSPIQQRLQQMAEEGTLETLGQSTAARSVAAATPKDRAKRRQKSRAVSSAARGDLSVAEIRRLQAGNAPHEVAGRKAATFEAAGKLVSAKLQYKRAADQAPEDQRTHWLEHFERVSRMIGDSKKK